MITLRPALSTDLPAITEIFNHYILNSNALFETNAVSIENREVWFDQFSLEGPYRLVVAEEDSVVVGYCASLRYRPMEAFRHTIETSIYVHPEFKGKGLGVKLYDKLFDEIKNEYMHMALVGIALPNVPSIALHKKLGFTEIGVFQEYARKNGQYISSLWMQKKLMSEKGMS